MRVNNYIYDDLVLKYSKTAQALKNGNADAVNSGKSDNVQAQATIEAKSPVKFDSVLAAVENSREIDTVLAEAAKLYSLRTSAGIDQILTFKPQIFTGPDTLLIDAAHAYSQAKNVSGGFDKVLHGDIS